MLKRPFTKKIKNVIETFSFPLMLQFTKLKTSLAKWNVFSYGNVSSFKKKSEY